ncbi:MAG: NrtA/SsuA/CpmA family ABC transporter substrate-binding protein [Deltaproteobacteria bacterium]|nr:NrtA/SsuA/CpmA family ABC transporter substrate-binding protein [Deltaproteobacteria bacterium]MBI3076345.1 NrtA/SsuA/CpmA family ABC transporter substrate-binding protein [Deltaproteobacteria bacterium]
MLRVADLITSTAGVATMVMQERGLPAKYSLRIDFVKFTNPALERAALLAGKLDVGQIDVGAAARLKSKETDVRVIYPALLAYHAIVVPKAGPIQAMKDLKGRRIGVFSTASAGTPIVTELLRQAGVNYAREVKQHVAPPAALPELIEGGQVDAVETWEPMVSQLLSTGRYRELFNFRQWYRERTGHDLLYVGVIMRGEIVEKHPDLVRRFVRMYQEANRIAQDPASRAVERWAEARKITDPRWVALLGERVRAAIATTYTRAMVEQQKTYLDLLAATGQIEAVPPGLYFLEAAP